MTTNAGQPVRLPMFPLGTPLLPGMVLPLHIFEDRYRALVHDVLAESRPRFGVVLIERGSEVGGGDVRASVGCVAEIRASEEYPDGRWGLVCVGGERFQIATWQPDAPYPIAEVTWWPEPERHAGEPTLGEGTERRVRRVAALASELGHTGLALDVEFSA
ncbi:MAG: LON peptidase substrate-binding domain-containing protein, partial [Actinomycetes bacterium]